MPFKFFSYLLFFSSTSLSFSFFPFSLKIIQNCPLPFQINAVASVPNFSPPSFLSFLWCSDVHSRLIHVPNPGAEPMLIRRARLSIIRPQPIGKEQRVSVKRHQQIWAREAGRMSNEVGERERVCVCCVSVCFGTRPTHYVLFLNLTVGWHKTILWKKRVYFQASKRSKCSIKPD